MLLDDSVELEYNEYSSSAEPMPLTWDIELSKIWIPSRLLPNRKIPINPNENKPFIFHTLEKLDESKSFSVYTEEHHQYHEPDTSSAVPSGISHILMNDSINKLQMQQNLPSSQNAVEWDVRLDIDNKKNSSLLEPQEIYNSTNKNAALWGKNTSNNCSQEETSNKASFEDLARRMAEILSEDEPFKADWHHEDGIETLLVTTSSTLNSISPSTKDSLEELYYSDEDENHFDVQEYELGNLECESPEKKYKCSIYTENSYVQEQLAKSFENKFCSLEQAQNDNDKTVHKSIEEIGKCSFETQNIAVGNVFMQTELDEPIEMETVVHSKASEQELLNCKEKSEDSIEKIVEFPIAYKRPPLQEPINKIKPQKEKKKTKKSKINIPLDNLFQSPEVDRFKVPEVDEFYENLIRQGKCQPRYQETYLDRFPCVNLPEKLQTKVQEFPTSNFPEISRTTLFWESAQQFIQSGDSELRPSSPQEITRKEEKSEPEHELKSSLDTLVIDNIPLNVSKETIESIILGFGELKKLTIEPHGKFQKAKLQMDFNYEVDWIIDCLNDSQPFGSFDKELVKCYRQT